jgi:hypothetical protein
LKLTSPISSLLLSSFIRYSVAGNAGKYSQYKNSRKGITSYNTGQFISPSGISYLCGTAARMATQKGSMSTAGETLQVSAIP